MVAGSWFSKKKNPTHISAWLLIIPTPNVANQILPFTGGIVMDGSGMVDLKGPVLQRTGCLFLPLPLKSAIANSILHCKPLSHPLYQKIPFFG